LKATYSPLVSGFDAYHALTVAEVLLSAMRGRTESRGPHFRADFASMDAHAYRQIVRAEAGTLRIVRS